MISGQNDIQTLYLYDASGALVTYASKALLTGAGWDLTWYDADGLALSSQPAWTLPAAGVSGRHQIKFPTPDGVWTCKVTLPTAAHVAAPMEFDGEGETYDNDSLASVLLSSQGIVISQTSISTTAEIFHGDSIVLDFTVLDAALTAIGASSLADCDARTVEIKLDSLDSSSAATVTTLSESILSDTVGARTIRGTLDAFPAGLAVPAGNKQTLAATAHLQLTKGAKVKIVSEIALTVKWKALS